ncbi:hypothetical protein F5B22DRAFT_336399 [Xylaria bambusicola]|uniref:uncharacterized protein n=1 Tax=Xylaria bambusicola TaxID=326684 RepID=UPI0020079C87|nr:uncharacterized protein F5B22DRAFT_336399 [Xylaria bambusicola]KAI0525380.1 hypothetical protein F5B22DRAFT_336399 [Xylaria bambusicola]
MAMPHLGLEIPAFGASAALSAVALGATRIELNALGSYGEGGLTPSPEDLKQFTSTADQSPPLRIMIRPRGPPSSSITFEANGVSRRDFLYTDEEFEEMEASIKKFTNMGLLSADRGDGFVFGILKEYENGEGEECARRLWCQIDTERCARLVQAAQPLKCVFHRAFDEIISCDNATSDSFVHRVWETGLEAVADCGFDGILTSGGLGRAVDNMKTLEQVIKKARTLRIEIIIGGGVRTANIGRITQQLELKTQADSVYLHSACLHGNDSEHINPQEVQGILAQLR